MATDDLVLPGTGAPPENSVLFYMGDALVSAPLYDGRQCALGTTFRFLGAVQSTGAAGTMQLGPGIAASAAGLVVPGSTWTFHAWFRDANAPSPCGTNANLTNAVGVTFEP